MKITITENQFKIIIESEDNKISRQLEMFLNKQKYNSVENIEVKRLDLDIDYYHVYVYFSKNLNNKTKEKIGNQIWEDVFNYTTIPVVLYFR
jgi:hypothetical protein